MGARVKEGGDVDAPPPPPSRRDPSRKSAPLASSSRTPGRRWLQGTGRGQRESIRLLIEPDVLQGCNNPAMAEIRISGGRWARCDSSRHAATARSRGEAMSASGTLVFPSIVRWEVKLSRARESGWIPCLKCNLFEGLDSCRVLSCTQAATRFFTLSRQEFPYGLGFHNISKQTDVAAGHRSIKLHKSSC